MYISYLGTASYNNILYIYLCYHIYYYIVIYYISKIIEIEGEIRSDLAAAAAVYICPEVASREKYHKSLGEI